MNGVSPIRNGVRNIVYCDACVGKNHTVTYSIQQMLYHMFFSSPQYTEPDIIVIYGNTFEMSISNNDINTKISYQKYDVQQRYSPSSDR